MGKNHIYHHFDADGYASAAVLVRYGLEQIVSVCGRENVLFHVVEHGTPMDLDCVIPGEDIVYIVDYSFSREDDKKNLLKLYDSMKERYPFGAPPIVWIDHHATSDLIIKEDERFKEMAMNGLVYTTNEYAGCMLTYFYLMYQKKMGTLHSIHTDYRIGCIALNQKEDDMLFKIIKDNWKMMDDSAPLWVRLTSDHDTFTHKIPYSSEFVLAAYDAGLYNVYLDEKDSFCIDRDGKDFNISPSYLMMEEYESADLQRVNQLIKIGKLLAGYRDRQNARLVENNGYPIKLKYVPEDMTAREAIWVYDIYVLNGYGNSEVFGEYYNAYDAVCVWNYDGNKYSYSMYCRKDSEIDCSKTALYMKEMYGMNGGGHKCACGWSTTEPVFTERDGCYTILI